VAGPELIQRWAQAAAGGVGRARSPYQATDPDVGTVEAGVRVVRVAFAGRTSTDDQQDPTLSLPRQLRSVQKVLPDNAVIVAHFYDIESGRTDLALRGRGHAHEALNIPIPRDGGIQDLLAEADRPDRRFDVVICESIDRISRRTYYGTMIEHRLEQAGVLLVAADEPFTLDPVRGRTRTATQVLTRRVKQGVSEWYVRDMLEKSWDGTAVHTELGYNIGKPCYGYTARRVPHPVPAKRAKGAKKTYLDPDPLQAPVVQRIFAWRVSERLGYQAIADRLNADLATNPPPTPIDPTRSVGRWTYSNVREVLTNPKHTGHMVWNRHARKSGHNRANPATDWIWSPQPTHEPLIDPETFVQAQQVAAHRFGSRTDPGPSRHAHTRRVYPLRTYLFCHTCGRRMFGKTRRQTAYYACAPKKGYRPAGHPASIWVREDALLDALHAFLAKHVFGAYRHTLLTADLADQAEDAAHDHAQRVTALRRAITDTDNRGKRLARNLELLDNPDPDLIRDINQRRTELRHHKAQLETQLADAEAHAARAPNPDLLTALPVGALDLDRLPTDLTRALFEALRLQIHYDKTTNQATCRITLSADTIHTAADTASNAINNLPHQERKDNTTMHADKPTPQLLPFPSSWCPRQDSNLRTRPPPRHPRGG
jgi:site-specific DNA recombinase